MSSCFNSLVPISYKFTSIIETLLLPFEEGLIPKPLERSSFFIRAQHSTELEEGWKDLLTCEQTLKAEFDLLSQSGFHTVTRLEGQHRLGMCLLTKHKKENYGNIARAWELLETGGILLCVGGNDIGVKSFEKNVRKEIAVLGNLHKNHCRVFWMEKTESAACPDLWKTYHQQGNHIEESDFVTQPGMFCWEKVDKGSAFLADHFPRKIKGPVADFGAGWGYLSRQLLEKFPDILELDLYEDEALALDAARQNLEPLNLSEKTNFHWTDLSGSPPKPNHYHWVIMNPPFHRSARTDVSLGIKFIENAARSLKRSGSLILVANRQLPYEKTLDECFKRTERIAESPDFKILLASTAILR